MNKLSEKQLLILTVGIAILLTGGLGYLIWRDLGEVKQCQAEVGQLQEKIQAAEVEIAQIPAREARVIANREIADKEVAFLPAETEIETFWEVLERFGDESGVQIYKISNNSTRAASGRRGASSSIESVEQVLSLRGTAEEFLRFIHLIENHDRIINVTEFALTAGRTEGEEKVRHTIRLAVKTFTYSKKIASTIVSINNYDKKKESPEVKKWLSTIKIEEKETYALRTSLGRRDPFADVRRRREVVADEGNPEPDRPMQEAILNNLVDGVRTLADGLDREDYLRKIGDLFRLQYVAKENRDLFRAMQAQIESSQREGLIAAKDLQDRFKTEVVVAFQAIKDRLGRIEETKPPLTLDQVQQYHKRVGEALDLRDWRRLGEEMRAWKDASKDGTHVVEEARELATEIAELKHKGDVIQDFERRKVAISAIVYNPSGLSLAVINGKQAAEGDALDGEGRVIVAEIGENYVIFSTEGVEIKRLQNGR